MMTTIQEIIAELLILDNRQDRMWERFENMQLLGKSCEVAQKDYDAAHDAVVEYMSDNNAEILMFIKDNFAICPKSSPSSEAK